MDGFRITTNDGVTIRFRYYENAPATATGFALQLPFSRTFMHARTSGEEIWIDNAPEICATQENASVFTEPGEVVYGPLAALRTKTRNCMGIYYGQGKGLDSCNIFAKVLDEDANSLAALGLSIWKEGFKELHFSSL